MTAPAAPEAVSFPALGTTASLLVTAPVSLDAARTVLERELTAVDRACSRFRPDSELARVNAAAGTPVRVGTLFGAYLTAALFAAEATGGAVDPTVGASVLALGYDRTFTAVAPEEIRPVRAVVPSADWRALAWDPGTRTLRAPAGVTLDFGASAKALAADRAAAEISRVLGCGALVNLGGDIAVAGPPPGRGWRVALADDHRDTAAGPVVAVLGGGLATSGTTVRAWRRGGRTVHHIVDPATGTPAAPVWRTVSVTAASCLEANAAATAAVVLGERGGDFLTDAGLAARLVRPDGRVTRTAGWPADSTAQEDR